MAETVCRMAVLLGEAPGPKSKRDAVKYFDKAASCVRKNMDPASRTALANVLAFHQKFLESELAADPPVLDLAVVQSKLTSVQSEANALAEA